MPRVVKKKGQNEGTLGKVFVLQQGEKRILVPRPKTYEAAVQAVCKHFPRVPKDSVVLQTDKLDVCEGHAVDIDPELWEEISELISSAIVKDTSSSAPPQESAPSPQPPPRPRVQPLAPPVGRVKRPHRKPVLYLHSPDDIDVSVTISLTSEWNFSAIYPVVPVKRGAGEQVRWDVRTRADGSLIEKTTGLEIAYLFWETLTNTDAPPSPPPSPDLGEWKSTEYFSPNSCELRDTDSVVLSVDHVTSYLDRVLQVLGLHTEARTSFITYWLPDMLKHTHIALRFIPQASYERAAPLDISPRPGVITRVFMLFKGVPEGRLSEWPGAVGRAEQDVQWLSSVVGVNLDLALDSRVFRALEWGGMEVAQL
ncbi:hypothetical protein BV22DRAFT_432297 [Leucogyrophana mollusca]|uniref:Uncharacterized protein n=1 Tax=Leucogyrophana mollusca TaxID=85980 RepID=A0ACB8BIL2_9AGAM|nr:hypothetical protein BV22DRAFT_432297 [Leucogyrophana mollusca]